MTTEPTFRYFRRADGYAWTVSPDNRITWHWRGRSGICAFPLSDLINDPQITETTATGTAIAEGEPSLVPDDVLYPPEGFDHWGNRPLVQATKFGDKSLASFHPQIGRWLIGRSYGEDPLCHYAILRGTDLHTANFAVAEPGAGGGCPMPQRRLGIQGAGRAWRLLLP